ncbi:hypothetical protein GIB67_035116 [Kingdonia uniflora]|uniref:Uncharacterized protein n=1 Tax=Kingdonia uniflora TaxID=39325 RepID=A0A7J7NVH2_9MAGN|nr:hypothetical protein GIB67_035116 [Kingdonia uniflora]
MLRSSNGWYWFDENSYMSSGSKTSATGGGGDAYSIGAITVMKAYYKQNHSTNRIFDQKAFSLNVVRLEERRATPMVGMLFAFFLVWVITLPIVVIQAATNQQLGYNIIAQFIIGYILLPGKPIANLLFKIYGRISTIHALSFLFDLKLGHYMKIPPRCMFTAQACP